MARVELERLAQRGLVAGGGERVGGRGDQLVEEALDLRRRDRAGELGHDLAVAERLHRGDPADVEARRRAPGWSRCRPWPAPLCRRASATAASSAGPSWRQGPHHSAQKSTTTGSSRERSTTSSMKFASVTSVITLPPRLASRAESTGWLEPRRRRLPARAAADRLAGARRPELRPLGGADHRARPRGGDGGRPQPALGDRGGARWRAELGDLAGSEPVFIGGPVQPQALVVLAEFTDLEAAAWIVVADVGFVGAETSYDELSKRDPPRPRLRRLLGLGRGPARGRDRRGGLDHRAAAAGRALRRRSGDALAHGARPQGRPVRAARADARRPVAELRRAADDRARWGGLTGVRVAAACRRPGACGETRSRRSGAACWSRPRSGSCCSPISAGTIRSRPGSRPRR